MTVTRTDAEYVDFDPFQGEDGEISCRTRGLRRARKSHPCFYGLGEFGDRHVIEPGDRYRHERGLVDGSFWGERRCCLPCIDRELSDSDAEPEHAA